MGKKNLHMKHSQIKQKFVTFPFLQCHRGLLFFNMSYDWMEKYKIAYYKGDNLLTKRTEIVGTCKHRNKYKLKNC